MRLLTTFCALTLAATFCGEALGRDRQPLSVAPDLAAERVLQLSPGSGIVPGYARQRQAQPYPAGTVVFEGSIPVGVVPADGGPVQPLGSYREQRRPMFQMFGAPSRPGERRAMRRARAPIFASTASGPGRAQARRTDPRALDPAFLPQVVDYRSDYPAGTIVIDTNAKFLYRIEGHGQARRYGVGVGKPGFAWAGAHTVTRKAEWPGWTPPSEMIAREARKGRVLPAHMEGGLENPLGARAMYLGSTLYRIHGTNQPWTIGQAVSSGCIRMRNEDVVDLYESTPVGTRVIVL